MCMHVFYLCICMHVILSSVSECYQHLNTLRCPYLSALVTSTTVFGWCVQYLRVSLCAEAGDILCYREFTVTTRCCLLTAKANQLNVQNVRSKSWSLYQFISEKVVVQLQF